MINHSPQVVSTFSQKWEKTIAWCDIFRMQNEIGPHYVFVSSRIPFPLIEKNKSIQISYPRRNELPNPKNSMAAFILISNW